MRVRNCIFFYPSAGITRIRFMGVISARYFKAPLRFHRKDNYLRTTMNNFSLQKFTGGMLISLFS